MNTTSYWVDSTSLPRSRKLEKDIHVDVAVVGGGITGITAAYLFKKSGCTVALIERGRCGGFDTVHTTAHLTRVTDMRLADLAAKFGKDAAKAVWDSGSAAIDQIVDNIRDEKIDCDFDWIPGYLHAATTQEAASKTPLFTPSRPNLTNTSWWNKWKKPTIKSENETIEIHDNLSIA
jgi:glycine/D-amino acid oxidase-like deaminating enzyme